MSNYKNFRIDYTRIGQIIQNARKEKKYSQAYVSERIGCSVTHLCRVESGSRTSLDLLYPLCQFLDLSLDDLVGLRARKGEYLRMTLELMELRPRHEQRNMFHMMEQFVSFMKSLENKDLYHRYHTPIFTSRENRLSREYPIEEFLYTPLLAAEEPASFPVRNTKPDSVSADDIKDSAIWNTDIQDNSIE